MSYLHIIAIERYFILKRKALDLMEVLLENDTSTPQLVERLIQEFEQEHQINGSASLILAGMLNEIMEDISRLCKSISSPDDSPQLIPEQQEVV